MNIFPAIDIKDGKVVRLTRGDYNAVTVYSSDAAEVARSFLASGAKFLHVVDLDGAKDGALSNFDTVREILSVGGLFVEIGGGIRDEARIRRYLDLGVSRVILGTAALRDPEFLRAMLAAYGEKIAVGVDARDGKVAVEGWLTDTGVDSVGFCRQVRDMGAKTVIYTDIAKDGAMGGTNLEIYRTLVSIEGLEIVASGGVSSEADITALRETGVSAAIVGKAIYAGALDLSRAIKLAEGAAV